MPVLNLKPTHKIVTNYYKALAQSGQLSLLHEGAVAPHFAALLRACAAPLGWSLQEQYSLPRKGQHPIRLDGALLDPFSLRHGVWEAKDRDDDLEKEARAKFKQGYPTDNILFQSPARALLYQDGRVVADEDITDPERLVEVLKLFFGYEPPAFVEWERAVAEFKDRVPELAQSLLALIEKERKENKRFVAAFDDFAEVARQAVNPNISVQAVEEMLIQHLLTERIFRKVFNNPDFGQRNVIAREIEKVIEALTSRSFSRTAFLGRLDRFYGAIETTAATIDNYREKQTFLNTVYEQFFQGFSVKVADTTASSTPRRPWSISWCARSMTSCAANSAGPTGWRPTAWPSSTRSWARATSSCALCARCPRAGCSRSTAKNCSAMRSCCCPTTSPA